MGLSCLFRQDLEHLSHTNIKGLMTVFSGIMTIVVQIRITNGYSSQTKVINRSIEDGIQLNRFVNATRMDLVTSSVVLD